MKEIVERQRSTAVTCAKTLLRIGIEAGRGYKDKPISDEIETYKIQWLNSDLLMDLLITRTLPASQLDDVHQAIDDGCFGIGTRVESGYHRVVNLYEAGVEITGMRMDLDAAEAELAKKAK